MRRSWLPEGGVNKFQKIKAKCAEAEESGIKLIKLSIGQPTGPALLSAREAAAKAVMSDEESMHEYQDNGSPGIPGFAQKFVQAHIPKVDLNKRDIAYLPIPGIKPILGMIPIACGKNPYVGTTTNPGYPTPVDQCIEYGIRAYALLTEPHNHFLFKPYDIHPNTNLIMMNYPHNPTGQISTRKWLEELCEYCQTNGIRLFNDGAYHMLAHSSSNCTLTEVALNYPDLECAEAFSASKVGNGTGWRVGAICGSKEFIEDIARKKGNLDSGFVAFAAAGVLESVTNDMDSIIKIRNEYEKRLRILMELLQGYGMQLAVSPGAGFFTLWKTPKKAFGEKVKDAEHFNHLMIEKTGVVGVDFDPYIRYAVVATIEDLIDPIKGAFIKANVSY